MIFSISESPFTKINLSLEIQPDFAVHMFCKEVEMNSIFDHTIPKYETDQNILEILIENMKKMDREQQQTKLQNRISLLKLVISFLRLVQKESCNLVKTNLYPCS